MGFLSVQYLHTNNKESNSELCELQSNHWQIQTSAKVKNQIVERGYHTGLQGTMLFLRSHEYVVTILLYLLTGFCCILILIC